MSALLDAALGYAARGIPVYPVHWPRHIPGGASLACSCPRGAACDRPAKHPLLRHGVKEATTDPDRIGRWWQRWPQANLGLATGVVFDALDVDGQARELLWFAVLNLGNRVACSSSTDCALGRRSTPSPGDRRWRAGGSWLCPGERSGWEP